MTRYEVFYQKGTLEEWHYKVRTALQEAVKAIPQGMQHAFVQWGNCSEHLLVNGRWTQYAGRVLWCILADTPVDNDGVLEEAFLHFPAGTDREDVWRWFEEYFDVTLGSNGEGLWLK